MHFVSCIVLIKYQWIYNKVVIITTRVSDHHVSSVTEVEIIVRIHKYKFSASYIFFIWCGSLYFALLTQLHSTRHTATEWHYHPRFWWMYHMDYVKDLVYINTCEGLTEEYKMRAHNASTEARREQDWEQIFLYTRRTLCVHLTPGFGRCLTLYYNLLHPVITVIHTNLTFTHNCRRFTNMDYGNLIKSLSFLLRFFCVTTASLTTNIVHWSATFLKYIGVQLLEKQQRSWRFNWSHTILSLCCWLLQ